MKFEISRNGALKQLDAFINSELGLYIDHFKGKRKQMGTSVVNDLLPNSEATKLDYWKQVPTSLPEKKK